jgi:threonine/homoserine/homoserine lactone efflux protein
MTRDVLVFLFEATVISLSGVLAPGPVTAATLAAGTRSRHAGALVAVGHGIVEFPLMLLIMAGMGAVFQYRAVRIAIGLVGGAFLILMGVQMLRGSAAAKVSPAPVARDPIWTGVILSVGNPYFLLWWATVGLALATRAMELGVLAFANFAVIHWLCDLGWLEALSLASFKGARLLGGRSQRVVLTICAAALLFFGAMFTWDAGKSWLVGQNRPTAVPPAASPRTQRATSAPDPAGPASRRSGRDRAEPNGPPRWQGAHRLLQYGVR